MAAHDFACAHMWRNLWVICQHVFCFSKLSLKWMFSVFFLLAKSLWLQESWLGYLSIFWQVSLEKLNNSACYHDDELPEPGCSVSSFTWRSLLPTHALERAHCTAFGLCCFKAQIFTEFSVWGVFFFLHLDWVVLHKSTFKRLQPKSQGSLLFSSVMAAGLNCKTLLRSPEESAD